MKKVIIYCILFLTLLFTNTSIIYADNVIDFSKKGYIDVTLTEKESNIPIKDAGLSAIKVADAYIKDSNLAFKNVSEVNSCGVDFTNLSEDFVVTEGLVNCILNTKALKNDVNTNSKGIAEFKDLDLGIYLVVQTGNVEGYSNIDSFLVSIPQAINNKWTYGVSAEPKTDIQKLVNISVTKVWNNEGKTNPKSVKISLLRDDLLIEEIVLDDSNNWTYTWKDMIKSDKYSVVEEDVPKDYTVSYRNEGYHFIVTNTEKLPQTGMVLWKIEVIAFIGMILLSTGIIINKKYEEN